MRSKSFPPSRSETPKSFTGRTSKAVKSNSRSYRPPPLPGFGPVGDRQRGADAARRSQNPRRSQHLRLRRGPLDAAQRLHEQFRFREQQMRDHEVETILADPRGYELAHRLAWRGDTPVFTVSGRIPQPFPETGHARHDRKFCARRARPLRVRQTA